MNVRTRTSIAPAATATTASFEENMTRQDAESKTILRSIVGSTAHGLNVVKEDDPKGEDRDEMGILIEPLQDAIGFSVFEQFIFRTAAEREGRHDAPSQAGDLDFTLYSLRKWCRLALNGNPTILMLLFAPPLQCDAVGSQLRDLAPAFLSKRAGAAFLGYLIAQGMRIRGDRGGMDVNRKALTDRYGYDTKYAMHALRLGLQGIQLMDDGKIELPIRQPWRSILQGVRQGQYPLTWVTTTLEEMEQALRESIDKSSLPDLPDREKVEKWMCRVYLESWKAHDKWWIDYPGLLNPPIIVEKGS